MIFYIFKIDEIYYLINVEIFVKMKFMVWIINCVRGGIIDEVVLVEVLKEGKIVGVVLDVYENEFLEVEFLLWGLG